MESPSVPEESGTDEFSDKQLENITDEHLIDMPEHLEKKMHLWYIKNLSKIKNQGIIGFRKNTRLYKKGNTISSTENVNMYNQIKGETESRGGVCGIR